MGLFDRVRETILSPSDIVDMAIDRNLVTPNNTPGYVRNNFSNLVEQIQKDAYEIYLEQERHAGSNAIKNLIRENLSQDWTVNDVINYIGSIFYDLDRFFLSLTQSRRPRAGKAFEEVLKNLFRHLDYPFDEQQTINGKPDFLLPSRQHYDNNPMDCIIFTVKRSLRERWRQIVTEGTRGLGFYLATIDDSITGPQLAEMLDNRIYLVVPQQLKNDNRKYRDAQNVISFEEFFKHHLEPAMTRWRSNGII